MRIILILLCGTLWPAVIWGQLGIQITNPTTQTYCNSNEQGIAISFSIQATQMPTTGGFVNVFPVLTLPDGTRLETHTPVYEATYLKAGGEAVKREIQIPFKQLKCKAGTQKATVSFRCTYQSLETIPAVSLPVQWNQPFDNPVPTTGLTWSGELKTSLRNEQTLVVEALAHTTRGPDWISSPSRTPLKAEMWFVFRNQKGEVLYSTQARQNSFTLNYNCTTGRSEIACTQTVQTRLIQALPDDNITIELWLDVLSQNKPIKAHAQLIPLKLPVRYLYTQQKISATPLQVGPSVVNNGASGFWVKSQIQFSINDEQLYFPKGTENTNYYFYATVQSGNQTVYVPALLSRKNEEEFVSKKAIKNKSLDVQLFIPHRLILLPKGSHAVTVQLHVSDELLQSKFPTLAEKNISLNQPETFLLSVKTKGIQLVERSYDVSGSNLPFVGLFQSNSSNLGKGYPDPIWTLRVGSHILFRSAVNNNSFYVPDGGATIRIAEKDAVLFVIADKDVLWNDPIAEFTLPQGMQNFKKTVSPIPASNIRVGSIQIEQYRIPELTGTELTLKPVRYQGVTGYDCTFQAQIDRKGADLPINLVPFIQQNDTTTTAPLGLQLVEGKLSVSSSGLLAIPPDASFIKVRYFLPAVNLNQKQPIGVRLLVDQFWYELGRTYAPAVTYFKKVDDIKAKLVLETPSMQNDQEGIKGKIQLVKPKIYAEQFKTENIWSAIQIQTPTSQNLLADWVPAYPWNHVSTMKTDSISFFIPYRTMQGVSNPIRFLHQSFWGDTLLQLGNTDTSLFIPMPTLVPLKGGLQYQAKSQAYTQYYVKIMIGNQTVFTTDTAASAKKLMWTISDPLIFAPNDVVTIGVFAKGLFDEEKRLAYFTAPAKEWHQKNLKLEPILDTKKAMWKGL